MCGKNAATVWGQRDSEIRTKVQNNKITPQIQLCKAVRTSWDFSVGHLWFFEGTFAFSLKKKLQDPGDFCNHQSREMEFHLCDNLLDTGLTSVFSQSWYQAEFKLKHSQPEASWVSLFSAVHLAALYFGGICNRNYFYTRSLTNLVLFILLQYLPF